MIHIPINLPHSGAVTIQENNIVSTSSVASTGIFVDLGTGSESLLLKNNKVVAAPTAGSIGISARSISDGTLCTSIIGNQVTLSSPTGTTGMRIATTGTGVVNIDNLTADQAPSVSISGNVNFVSPGTCGLTP